MFIQAIDTKKLQVNGACRWNQTVKRYYIRKYSYNQANQPWYGAYELCFYKLHVTIYIWRHIPCT